MKILLLEDVRGVGKRMEMRTVKTGYARNFLLPRRLAIVADARAHAMRKAWELRESRGEASRAATRVALATMVLQFPMQSGPAGNTFGSVTALQIDAALRARGVAVDAVLLERPLKTLGSHTVLVRVGHGETTPLTVALVPKEKG